VTAAGNTLKRRLHCLRTGPRLTGLPELHRDIGTYWGTLLAVGGYTEGESFVSRNVGLKALAGG